MTVHGERRDNYTDGMSDDKWSRRNGNYKQIKTKVLDKCLTPLRTTIKLIHEQRGNGNILIINKYYQNTYGFNYFLQQSLPILSHQNTLKRLHFNHHRYVRSI
jgi:hypothetical protein